MKSLAVQTRDARGRKNRLPEALSVTGSTRLGGETSSLPVTDLQEDLLLEHWYSLSLTPTPPRHQRLERGLPRLSGAWVLFRRIRGHP